MEILHYLQFSNCRILQLLSTAVVKCFGNVAWQWHIKKEDVMIGNLKESWYNKAYSTGLPSWARKTEPGLDRSQMLPRNANQLHLPYGWCRLGTGTMLAKLTTIVCQLPNPTQIPIARIGKDSCFLMWPFLRIKATFLSTTILKKAYKLSKHVVCLCAHKTL